MNKELHFQTLFNAKLKEHGFTVKKLADATGIPLIHLEHISRGEFARLPAAPYVRGYLVKLAPVLAIDAQQWWHHLEREVRVSGEHDAMPRNRFARQSRSRLVWAGLITLIVIIYFSVRFSSIFGRPQLIVSSPTENELSVSSQEFTVQGTVANADTVTINDEPVEVAQNGTWHKTFQLQSAGLNSFQIKATKFLGGASIIEKRVFYEPNPTAPPGTEVIPLEPQPSSSVPEVTSTTPTIRKQ